MIRTPVSGIEVCPSVIPLVLCDSDSAVLSVPPITPWSTFIGCAARLVRSKVVSRADMVSLIGVTTGDGLIRSWLMVSLEKGYTPHFRNAEVIRAGVKVFSNANTAGTLDLLTKSSPFNILSCCIIRDRFAFIDI